MNTTRTKKAKHRHQYKTALIKWCRVAESFDGFGENDGSPYRDNKPGVIDAGFLHNASVTEIRYYHKAAKALNYPIYLSNDAWTLPDEDTGQIYSLKGSHVGVYLPYSALRKTFRAVFSKVGIKMDIKTRNRSWFTLGFGFPDFPPKGIPGLTKIQKHLGRKQKSQNGKTKAAIAIRQKIKKGNRQKESTLRIAKRSNNLSLKLSLTSH